MELVGKAWEEYQLKVALLSVEQDPSALPPGPSLLAQAQETLQVLDLSSASDGASHDEADDECERSNPPEPKGVSLITALLLGNLVLVQREVVEVDYLVMLWVEPLGMAQLGIWDIH